MSVATAENNVNYNNNANNIIFTIKYTKLYVPVVTLSAKDNKNCQNFLAKELKDQFIGANIKKKSEDKNTTNEFRYFLEPNFVGVNRSFF